MSIGFWPEWKKSDHWNNFWEHPEIKDYWEVIFDRMYQSKIDTWDYPWLASLLYKGGLTITPNKNMVSNIGFGAHSTHTKSKNSRYSKLKTHSIGLISHPDEIIRDSAADIYTFRHHFNEKHPFLVDCFFSIIKRIVKILAR
jgi:flavin-dependent dehydrogenase